MAALGGAVGGLALVVVALLGGPLLDALDVSDPAMRIAAGAVVAVAGLVDLARRPPSSEPALDGWRAALVPVAVPLVVRPALVLAAIGADADRGLWLVAGALVAGLAAMSALTLVPTAGVGPRVGRWLAAVVGALAAAAGVLLVIDGVLAV